jgi:16S rRNA (uracil1498-N3)-methyltransferase
MSKYFRVDVALRTGEEVPLEAHRFLSVLRLGVGDELVLCDPEGALHRATITGVRPLVARIEGPHDAPERNPRAPLEVWLPLLKGGRSDELVRQLTELGATRIVPFSSRFAVVRLEGRKASERQRRFEAIAREACNQCGRTELPEIAPPHDGLPQMGPGAFLWEGGGEAALEAVRQAPELAGRILTGPDGGLGLNEAEHLISLNWKPLTLGHRILRADTAVLVLAALSQAVRGSLE